MALHFVTDDAGTAHPGATVTLTGTEAHHAAAVRRVRVDEAVTLGDGRGVWLSGVVVAATPKQVDVRVTARDERPAPSPRFVLVQALAKGDRDELAVQAATELGVDAIVPWQAARSVSRWDAKADKGLARWRTIVREAAKQAHRAWIPEVEAVARTADLVRRAGGATVLVLEPSASIRLTEATARTIATSSSWSAPRAGSPPRSSRRSPPPAPARCGWATRCCAPRPREPRRSRCCLRRTGAGDPPGRVSEPVTRLDAMSEPSIFTRILQGEIPAEIVAETENAFAIRDIAPQAPVHLLVIPKTPQYRTVVELAAGDPALLTEVIGLANSVAAEYADGDFRLIFNTGEGAGQTVFHVHAHVLAGGLNEKSLGG